MEQQRAQGPPVERVTTGVAGLDRILRGGLLQGGSYIISGNAGTGKTILANQACFQHVGSGSQALYMTLLTESHARMLLHLRSLSFFSQEPIGTQLHYFSAYHIVEQGGLEALMSFIRGDLRARRPAILVLDGLSTAAQIAESEIIFKKFLHELHVAAELSQCTTLLLMNPSQYADHPEEAMVDGVIQLADTLVGSRAVRELTVTKFRGSSYLRGRHLFRITDDGLVVYPQTEVLLAEPSRPARELAGRMRLGIAALDQMLQGGLLESSSSLVLGPSGAGKTILGLHFLAAGYQAGEPGIHFGFYEMPPDLIGKAERLGLDLRRAREQNLLQIHWQAPLGCMLDELAERLLSRVERMGARRLFIDGLNGLEQAAVYKDRVVPFFTALTNELRTRGVTTLFSIELPRIFGPQVDVPMGGVSALADNMILLRSVEIEAQLYRLISILKTRGSAYNPAIHTFTIEADGIKVGKQLSDREGLLTGTARHAGSATTEPDQERP